MFLLWIIYWNTHDLDFNCMLNKKEKSIVAKAIFAHLDVCRFPVFKQCSCFQIIFCWISVKIFFYFNCKQLERLLWPQSACSIDFCSVKWEWLLAMQKNYISKFKSLTAVLEHMKTRRNWGAGKVCEHWRCMEIQI